MVGFTFLLLSLGFLYSQAQPVKFPECGESNPNGFEIDDSEPANPSVFREPTSKELINLRTFLENDPKIRASKSSNATLNSSYIFTVELYLPPKEKVLNHLDNKGPQPVREARVVMFRGDKQPPRVEEYVCGPLDAIEKCTLLTLPSRRNPTEYTIRPMNGLEQRAIKEVFLQFVDSVIGKLLMESYGAKFTGGKDEDCLTSTSAPVGTAVVGDIKKRLMWVTAAYNLPYRTVHMLDLSFLVDFSDVDPDKWTILKVWYCNQLFSGLVELMDKYNNNTIEKTKVTKPVNDDNLFSSLKRRGDPQPPKPQRPPRLVEPDGKRYSVKNRKVQYLGWEFIYDLPTLTGPAIYDVKFKGERIAYEIKLANMATPYSSFAPFGQTLNEIETGRMLGSRAKAVVPGAGCPETGTSLSSTFMNQYGEDPAVYNASWCIFENNNGHPLRRHLSYEKEEGGFYAGMMDSALTIRTAITILQNDYFCDCIFHQNGVIEVKVILTGYLQTTLYTPYEKPYGHRIHDDIVGNVHEHLLHFKVDPDVTGTRNTYQTLVIKEDKTKLAAFSDKPYTQTKIETITKKTEKESISDFNFDTPKIHLFHGQKKNKNNETRAFRIDIQGLEKGKLPDSLYTDRGLSWARYQMVVTKRKEEERTSSSIYAMFDDKEPVVNFPSFSEDNENIENEDLVAWITLKMQHIPHSEDLPNIAAVGNHMNFFLIPHNYHTECPSISSRDAIYIEYKDKNDPSKGVRVDRNGNTRDQCVIPKPTLEEILEDSPDTILECERPNPTDF